MVGQVSTPPKADGEKPDNVFIKKQLSFHLQIVILRPDQQSF